MFVWMSVLLVYMAIDNAIFDMTCCGIALLVVVPVLKEHMQEIKSRKHTITKAQKGNSYYIELYKL